MPIEPASCHIFPSAMRTSLTHFKRLCYSGSCLHPPRYHVQDLAHGWWKCLAIQATLTALPATQCTLISKTNSSYSRSTNWRQCIGRLAARFELSLTTTINYFMLANLTESTCAITNMKSVPPFSIHLLDTPSSLGATLSTNQNQTHSTKWRENHIWFSYCLGIPVLSHDTQTFYLCSK